MVTPEKEWTSNADGRRKQGGYGCVCVCVRACVRAYDSTLKCVWTVVDRAHAVCWIWGDVGSGVKKEFLLNFFFTAFENEVQCVFVSLEWAFHIYIAAMLRCHVGQNRQYYRANHFVLWEVWEPKFLQMEDHAYYLAQDARESEYILKEVKTWSKTKSGQVKAENKDKQIGVAFPRWKLLMRATISEWRWRCLFSAGQVG